MSPEILGLCESAKKSSFSDCFLNISSSKSKPRRARGQELRSKVQHFRDAFQINYLPDNVEEFGFPILLSDVPFEVLRQADYLVETLAGPNVVLPEPKIGTGLPIPALVGEIKTLADALRLSLDATDREVKLAEIALVDKDDAAADWDQLLSWGARTITGLFILAGKPELAARVLPSARRGQTGVVDGEGGAGEGETDGPELPGSEEPPNEPPTGEESERAPSESTPPGPAS